jgi:hypothetical protein
MNAYRYLFVALVVSVVAANDGFAAAAQVSKNERRAGASDKVVATKGGHPRREAPKSGAQPAASGTVGGQTVGSGKGTSGINGTGTGSSRTPSIKGTGMGPQH